MKSFSFWFFIAPFYHILSGYFRISVLVICPRLPWTSLVAANLSEAAIDDADLSGANIKGAKITKEQLDSAKSLKDAIMPDGPKHP